MKKLLLGLSLCALVGLNSAALASTATKQNSERKAATAKLVDDQNQAADADNQNASAADDQNGSSDDTTSGQDDSSSD